jgi:putative RecB family exonuclease
MDVQLGLYYLALEQVYQQTLKRLTLLFLRTEDCIHFNVTAAHREQVRLIADWSLAQQTTTKSVYLLVLIHLSIRTA